MEDRDRGVSLPFNCSWSWPLSWNMDSFKKTERRLSIKSWGVGLRKKEEEDEEPFRVQIRLLLYQNKHFSYLNASSCPEPLWFWVIYTDSSTLRAFLLPIFTSQIRCKMGKMTDKRDPIVFGGALYTIFFNNLDLEFECRRYGTDATAKPLSSFNITTDRFRM